MRKNKKNRPAAVLVAGLATLSALSALGAACHLDALIGPTAGPTGGLDSLVQLRGDSTTMIPFGGSDPEPSIVVRAVVRRGANLGDTLRVQVEVRPVGTGFQGQPTATSVPTPSGARAYARVDGLTDSVGYHWQARLVDQFDSAGAWRAYNGRGENAADFRVAVSVTATRLVFTHQPATTTADATMLPVEVTMEDGQGSTITSFTGTVYLEIAPGANPGGDNLAKRSVSAVAGVATFSDVTLTKAGTGYKLQATSDGVAAVSSTSFGINPASPDHLVVLQEPSNTRLNQAITPAVRVAVHDVYSNVVTAFTDIVFMNIGNNGAPLGNGMLDPAGTHRAAAAGVATFEDLRIDQVGLGYTLQASAANTRGVTSAPFDITP
jgi:hypothetical protein